MSTHQPDTYQGRMSIEIRQGSALWSAYRTAKSLMLLSKDSVEWYNSNFTAAVMGPK